MNETHPDELATRCTATIDLWRPNGICSQRQCERNFGEEHFDHECMHECKIFDAGGNSGVIVRWATFRLVQDAVTPLSTSTGKGE
jgi:hypothetical protein